MTVQILDKNNWVLIRQKIKDSYVFNDDWLEVIERFEKRIHNHYFKPIQNIQDPDDLKGEGFSILTIQCAVIEMLAAFRFGKIYNHRKPNNGGLKFEYKKADECFIRFLHTASIFEDNFFKVYNSGRKKNIPFCAEEFYRNVRCGLMHEGRTKKGWLINAKKVHNYSGAETQFLTKNRETGAVSIDRAILNRQLTGYFNSYIAELKGQSESGSKLRMFLGRKLDNFYDIQRDTNYDWWRVRATLLSPRPNPN